MIHVVAAVAWTSGYNQLVIESILLFAAFAAFVPHR